jgi:hypothetical protein
MCVRHVVAANNRLLQLCILQSFTHRICAVCRRQSMSFVLESDSAAQLCDAEALPGPVQLGCGFCGRVGEGHSECPALRQMLHSKLTYNFNLMQHARGNIPVVSGG